jgi:hypothetical protein
MEGFPHSAVFSMRVLRYQGEVWEGKAVYPELWDLLLEKDLLIEIETGPPPHQIVVGVPHQAGPEIDTIADHWLNPKTGELGRPADENTGLCGLALFSALSLRGVSCKLVIAAHPLDHDPNKTPGRPYWESVFDHPSPGLLFELHGASFKRHHMLELSAGMNQRATPLKMGAPLADLIEPHWSLAVQVRAGSRDAMLFHERKPPVPGRLQNPALQTKSLAHAGNTGFPALHLEMKPALRRLDPDHPDAPRPARDIWHLSEALAILLDGSSPRRD